MGRKNKKSTNAREIATKALIDLIIGTILILIDKYIV